MMKFKSLLTNYTAVLLCAAVALFIATSCSDDDDKDKDKEKTIAVTGITVAPSTATLTVGQTQGLTVTVFPADASNTDYSWSSSNPTVAIMENNVVNALAAGNAVITATTADGGFTATCNVTVSDEGGSGGDDTEYTVVELNSLTQGEMDFYGKIYGETGTDYNNWTVYLAGAGFDFESFDGDGEMLQLEINTAGSVTTEIPSGTYTVMTDLSNEYFVPFSAVPAFIQEEEDGMYPYGTWYLKDLSAEYGATSGTATFDRQGDVYTVTFEFQDDEAMVIFKGSYTGKLGYYDGTATESVSGSVKAQRASHKSGKHAVLVRRR